MEVISFGDHIEKGTYEVHSTFKNLVNFTNKTSFLTIASPDKQYGPFTIIISDLFPIKINYVKINEINFEINNYTFHIEKEKIWKSDYSFPNPVKLEELKNNICAMIKYLYNILPCDSLLFILNDNNYCNTLKDNSFEKELYLSLKQGIQNLLINKNNKEGILMLKSKGKGLTPSGDDFITGYLYALYVWEKINGKNTAVLRNNTYELACANNVISNYQLKAAKNGWFNKSFMPILDCLLKNKKITNNTFKIILSYGSSSGIDILSGFLLTLKYLIVF